MMQVQRWTLGQTMVQGFLAVWLGLIVPLLCVPGISSTHTHGIHWVWEQPGAQQANAPAHSHEHSHSHDSSHAHSHAVESAPASSVNSGPTESYSLRSNQSPQVEELMNVFGIMGTVPTGLPLMAIAGLVVLVGGAWLFRAVPPFAPPWNPPKAFS